MTRLEANREIAALILKEVEQEPELRFYQILWSLGLDTIDFYEESQETLEKIS